MKRIFVFVSILLITQPVLARRKKKSLELPMYEVVDTLATYANPGRLSPDGLTFVCGLVEDDGNQFLHYWSRSTMDDAWEGPHLIEGKINEIGSFTENMQPTISSDGLRMVFVRNDESSWVSNDLWMAIRTSISEPFDSIRELEELNTYNVEAYPYITARGNRLYYTFMDGLMVAEYDPQTGYYTNPDTVPLDWTGFLISCWVSADEKTLVFNDGGELYYASRSRNTEGFVVRDSFSFSEEISFRAAPSFDADGELYLYVPGTYDYDYDEEYDGVELYKDYFDGDGEGLDDNDEYEVIESNSDDETEYVYEPEEPERLNNLIIRLRPVGEMPFDIQE